MLPIIQRRFTRRGAGLGVESAFFARRSMLPLNPPRLPASFTRPAELALSKASQTKRGKESSR